MYFFNLSILKHKSLPDVRVLNPVYFSVLQTEQSLYNDADQIENVGHSNTTMLALVPSARSVTDTFPANQGESIHIYHLHINFFFENFEN